MFDYIISSFTHTTKWLHEFFHPGKINNARAVSKMNEILLEPFRSIVNEKNQNLKLQWRDYYKNKLSSTESLESNLSHARRCLNLLVEEEKAHCRKKSNFILYASGLAVVFLMQSVFILTYQKPSGWFFSRSIDQIGCDLFDCNMFGTPSFYLQLAIAFETENLLTKIFQQKIRSIPKMQWHELSSSTTKYYTDFLNGLPANVKNSLQQDVKDQSVTSYINALQKAILNIKKELQVYKRNNEIKLMQTFFAGAEDPRSKNVYRFFQGGGYDASKFIFNNLFPTKEIEDDVDRFINNYKKTSVTQSK